MAHTDPALSTSVTRRPSRRTTGSVAAAAALLLASLGALAASPAQAAGAESSVCAQEGGFCSFDGTREVKYGADGRYVVKALDGGTPCTNDVFGDPAWGIRKACAVLPKSASGGSSGVTLQPTQAEFEAAVKFDFEGENGRQQNNPGALSAGYPCGVPSNYSWKYSTTGASDVAGAVNGRGPQTAGVGYNQVYNACGTRKTMPNARVEFTTLVVDYFSISRQQWVRASQQTVGGAAYAEDFVNDQATGADIRDEANGLRSVRSGVGNASGDAGASTGRTVADGSVGYNFHGFPNRFAIDWADVGAIVASQEMRCIPQSGSDSGDCDQLGYLGNIGIDSWATTGSGFDGFRTHGGVSGGRFKPVSTEWQIFTNYVGPRDFAGITPPSAPSY